MTSDELRTFADRVGAAFAHLGNDVTGGPGSTAAQRLWELADIADGVHPNIAGICCSRCSRALREAGGVLVPVDGLGDVFEYVCVPCKTGTR